MSTNGMGVRLDFDGEPTADSAQKIRRLEDIPDIRTMNVPPIDYIVTGLFARGTVTLCAGIGGCAKSYLAQSLAFAVSTGTPFLGRTTKKSSVLYLDYENPSYAVRDRLDLIAGEQLTPNLHVWGTWIEQQPPPIGSELLATIAKETKPLLIIDPFRFAHGQDENDATAMMGVMQCLRSYAAFGCAVVLLHHLAKTEGSTGRGSTAIRDHSDAAFVQELSGETGLIALKGSKNRFGLPLAVCIRPDFESGTFEVADSPAFNRVQDELEKLRKIIAEQPGISTSALHKIVGGRKQTLVRRLNENVDKLWSTSPGPYKANLYYPIELFPSLGTAREQRNNPVRGEDPDSCSPVPPLYKGNREQPGPTNLFQSGSSCSGGSGKSLPQCPACHGYDLYREPSGKMVCQTCEKAVPIQ